MPPQDVGKHVPWLAEGYGDTAAPCASRHATKDSVAICESDALAGRVARAASVDDRWAVVLGALVGDVLAVTSHGLPHAKAAKLSHELCPWPWQVKGNAAMNMPAKGATVLGAQLLATLRAFESSIGRPATAEELAASDAVLTDFEARLGGENVVRPPVETWLDVEELADELCGWYTALHGASSVVDTKTLASVAQLYERRRSCNRAPRPPPQRAAALRPGSVAPSEGGGSAGTDAEAAALRHATYPFARRGSRGGVHEYLPPHLRARRGKYYDDPLTGRPADPSAAAAEEFPPSSPDKAGCEAYLLRRAAARRGANDEAAYVLWGGGLREGHQARVAAATDASLPPATTSPQPTTPPRPLPAPLEDGRGDASAATSRTRAAVYAPLLSDFRVSPTTTSAGCLTRNMAAAAVVGDKRLAITAAVVGCLLTHSHPVEVLCCVVHTVLLFDAVHYDHKPDVVDTAYYEALLLARARTRSAWRQWKEDVAHPQCRAWLAAVGTDLARYEQEVVTSLSELADYNPFAPPAEHRAHTAGDGYAVLRTLKIALWTLHCSRQGRFPKHLVDAWTRREDYEVPVKYRTRIEKERKMVAAGLIPSVPNDFPGGIAWNALDCRGGFDGIVWAALLGGEAVANAMVAGSLLGAFCGVPCRWAEQVGVRGGARELLRRAVGVLGPAAAAPEAETGGEGGAPAWLVEVTAELCPSEKLARMVNFHLRGFLQEHPPVDGAAAPTEHEAAEAMARACLPLHAQGAAFAALRVSKYAPRLRTYTYRNPDAADPDFESRCSLRTADPLDLHAELTARGRRPVAVYLADPSEAAGAYQTESDANDENQLLKRTTAWLNLYPRRARRDERMHPDIAGRIPSREPAYPMPSTAVLYLPTVVVCKDRRYRWLPVTQRACASALLMAHHRRDPWEMSEAAVIRKRMAHALEMAAEHGHDAVVLPSFGYAYIKELNEEAIRGMWIAAAANYSHVFKEVVLAQPRPVPQELKDGHTADGIDAQIL
eukprot:TRINITY_DN11953_c0_g1_i1.p1 TRINITY_DN11953_c0_g1~~TRINITY_DN11953_c0_g1_i1.p1  ORF type:complete len:1001 (+),score=312.71 TRINITY_DN11953_c0_g1_i1:94-3096(+)